MIYFFHGTDMDKARAKWRRVGESFAHKYPTGQIFRFTGDNWSAGRFEELALGIDLLGEKRLVFADRILENEEAAEFVGGAISSIAGSRTVFAFLEEKPPASLVKKIEKLGGKVEQFVLSRDKAKNAGFNVWRLTDALGARDRRGLWIAYQQALGDGLAPEEIFWKLVWQTKTMLLVRKSSRPIESLKPFVVSKAESFNRHYQEGELERLSGDLVALWHESKEEDGRDFAIGLERLILNL